MVKSSGFKRVPRDFYLLLNYEIYISGKEESDCLESGEINFDGFKSRNMHLSSNERHNSPAKIAINCVS